MTGNDLRCMIHKHSWCFMFHLCLITQVMCVEYKTCTDEGTFRHFIDYTIDQCSNECSRRQRCQMFMIRHIMNLCSLKESIEIPSDNDIKYSCGYYARGEMLSDDLGACSGQPCDVTERCCDEGGSSECVKTECPVPGEIENAHLLSKTFSVGTKNRYKCNQGYKGKGTPTITCTKNATWTKTDFQCVRPNILKMFCPEPEKTYHNAVLTDISGTGNIGTVLTYTCKNNYTRNGDHINITCLESGNWEPEYINCSRVNITVQWNNRDTKLIDGGIVASWDDAIKYCEDIEGILGGIDWEFSSLFNRSKTRFILVPRTITQLNEYWNFSKCATKNDYVLKDLNLSFKEKVVMVRNNGWFGDECMIGFRWAKNQPEGLYDCIAHRYDHMFLKYDIPCSFQENVGFACQYPNLPKLNP